jgi:hypothetical protein
MCRAVYHSSAVMVTGSCLHCGAALLYVVTINSLLRTISTDNASTVTATSAATLPSWRANL